MCCDEKGESKMVDDYCYIAVHLKIVNWCLPNFKNSKRVNQYGEKIQ